MGCLCTKYEYRWLVRSSEHSCISVSDLWYKSEAEVYAAFSVWWYENRVEPDGLPYTYDVQFECREIK